MKYQKFYVASKFCMKQCVTCWQLQTFKSGEIICTYVNCYTWETVVKLYLTHLTELEPVLLEVVHISGPLNSVIINLQLLLGYYKN